MSHVFNTSLEIHENYDLKGSTIDRSSSATEGSKKDEDFKRKIYLGRFRDEFLEMLESDTKVIFFFSMKFPYHHLNFWPPESAHHAYISQHFSSFLSNATSAIIHFWLASAT